MRKITTALFTAALAASFSAQADTEVVQDCVLEGVVKQSETNSGVQSIYIDFHSVKRFSGENRCNLRDKNVEFDGIVGSQISEVGPGSKVQYRYTVKDDKSADWQLIEVSI